MKIFKIAAVLVSVATLLTILYIHDPTDKVLISYKQKDGEKAK